MSEARAAVRDAMEKAYFHEQTVSHNIFASLTLPYTMIAAGIGATVFLVRQIPSDPGEFFWWAAVAGLVGTIVSLVVAACSLINASFRNQYKYIYPGNMNSYFYDLIKYYGERGSSTPESDAFADFENELIEQYAEGARYNQRTNFAREGSRQTAFSALLVAGAFLLASAGTLTLGSVEGIFDESGRTEAQATP